MLFLRRTLFLLIWAVLPATSYGASAFETLCMSLLKISPSFTSFPGRELPTHIQKDLFNKGLELSFDSTYLNLSLQRAAWHLGYPTDSTHRQEQGVKTRTWSLRPSSRKHRLAGEMALIQFQDLKGESRRLLMIEVESQTFEGRSIYLDESLLRKSIGEIQNAWRSHAVQAKFQIQMYDDADLLRESHGSEKLFWIETSGIPKEQELFFQIDLLARLSALKAPYLAF